MTAASLELGELVDIVMGQAPPGPACNKDGNGTVFVKAGEFQERSPVVREWTTQPLKMAAPDDTLVCVVGATAGKVNYSAFDCAIGRSVAAVRPKRARLEPLFLYRFLQTKVEQLRDRSQGAAQGVVTREMLQGLRLLVPPLPEQRRIAAILDKADALRAKRREALSQLDRLAQSIFVEMFGDPVANSKEWNLAPLPDATDFQEGPGILARDFREEGIPLVRLAGMGGAEVSLRGCNFVDPAMFARKWSHFALEEGDILVLTSATFGSPTVVGKEAVGALFYTGIIRFRPKARDLDSTYLRHYLASPWFLRQATALASGAVIKHFGPTHLRQMTIPVPPLQLQRQFAARTAALESLRIQSKAGAAAMEQLFASVQQQAFSGGL